MTTKEPQNTDRKDGQESGHPSNCDEMTKMIEKCGCGPMMAKMMATCMGAGGTEDAPKEAGAKQGVGERQSAE